MLSSVRKFDFFFFFFLKCARNELFFFNMEHRLRSSNMIFMKKPSYNLKVNMIFTVNN